MTNELLYIPGSQMSSSYVRSLWRKQEEWLLSYSISQVHKCHLPMSNPCEENNRSDYWVTLYSRSQMSSSYVQSLRRKHIPGSQISSFFVHSPWRIQQEWLFSYSIFEVTNVTFLCSIPVKNTTGVTFQLLYIQGHKCHLSLLNPREEYNRSDFLVTLYSRSQMSPFFAQSPWRIQQEWLFSYSIFKVTNVTFLCSIPVKNTTGVTFKLLYIQGHKCHLSLLNPREEYNRSDFSVTLYSRSQMSPFFAQSPWRIQQEWLLSYSIFKVTNIIFLCPFPVKNITGVTFKLLYIQGHKCHLSLLNPREEYNRSDFSVTLYSRSQMSPFFAQSPWRIQQEWLLSYSIFKVTNVTFLCSIPVKNTTGVTFQLLYIQGHKCHLSLLNPREEYNRSDFLVTLYSRSQMPPFFVQSLWRIQ